MKGRIKMYNSSRGFGFIAAEDENDYFFHISDVKTIADIARGMLVTFEKATGPKGPVAKEIRVTSVSVNQPEFLAIQDVRIKIRDIRSYSIEPRDHANRAWAEHFGRYDLLDVRCLIINTYSKGEFEFWSDEDEEYVDKEFERIDKILNGGQSQNF